MGPQMSTTVHTLKPTALAGTEPTTNMPAAPPAADLADLALLPLRDVLKLTGRSASGIHELVRTDRFPQPLRDGTRCTRWQAGKVRAWLIEQAQASELRAQADAQVKARAIKASAAAQTPAARSKAKATRAGKVAARAIGSASIATQAWA